MAGRLWSLLRARLRGLFRRDNVAGEIREELDFHVRMRAEDYERNGVPHADATAVAKRRFGNVAVWQDRGYDVRGGGALETIWQDLKYGARLLRRQPGFSTIAILTVALGVGMTTAIFSIVDAALLHPLPYPHPEELVNLTAAAPDPKSPTLHRYGLSLLDLQTIRAAPDPPVDVAMWRRISGARIVDGLEPERLRGMEIDAHYLGLFGIAPVRGRGFQERDTLEGAPRVAIIGYGYWQRRFAGRDDAVGQQLRLDQDSYEIIGILPRSFYSNTALWLPLRLSGSFIAGRGTGAITYARLRRGLSTDQASRELTRILAGSPDAIGRPMPRNWYIYVETLFTSNGAGYWTTANILLGSVGLILLIACVNVGGLLTARGAARVHEIAIRSSIGAGRARVIRQLFTESLLLAVAGGIAGLLFAWLTIGALMNSIPLPLNTNAPPSLSWRVLGMSLLFTLATALMFGLAPALKLSRVRELRALARGTPRAGASISSRTGGWLIGAEVALALVLLTGATLMIKSFNRLVATDLGFDPQTFVTLEASPAELNATIFTNYYGTLVDSIRKWPDVQAVGAANHVPLSLFASYRGVKTDADKSFGGAYRQVLPGYFEALGLSPRQGRFPNQQDLETGRQIVVINQRAANEFFKGQPAVGRHLSYDVSVNGMNPEVTTAEVIGVVPDLRNEGGIPTRVGNVSEVFVLYRPLPSDRPDPMVIVVRPKGEAAALAERLRRAAAGTGTRAVVERVRPGTDWLDDIVATPRQRTTLLGLLGGLGLLLTLVGVFGITAYAVSRRTQEIGVRMAFGARAGDVVREMVRDAAKPVFVGIVAGLVGSWFATRLISTFLYQTPPNDAMSFAIAATALAITAILAILVPARRAARVNPITSLRAE